MAEATGNDRSPPAPGDRRRRRGAVAHALMRGAPDTVALLDWDDLDRAPDWLTMPEHELAQFRCRVGAVLYARSIALWIDGPRLAAARDGLGQAFLAAVISAPEATTIPLGLVTPPSVDSAAQVKPRLQAAGAGVLLAALPFGPWRRAAAELLAPAVSSGMSHELALSVVRLAQALAGSAPATGSVA